MNAVLKQIKSWLDCWESWVAALMTAGILCSMKLKKKLLKFFFQYVKLCLGNYSITVYRRNCY